MKTVQIKNLQIQLRNAISIGSLALLTSCGDVKSVVEAPKINLDPPKKESEARQGEDPLAAKQWALGKIGAPVAWQAVGTGTRRMNVVILSSGVDYNHEDLQGNLYYNKKEDTGPREANPIPIDKKDSDGNGYTDDLLGWDVVDSDGFPWDVLGDGTAAAGIIGARHNNGVGIKGILNDVTIVPVRYIDSSGATSLENLIQALKYVNAMKTKADVVLLQLANVDFAKIQAEGASSFLDGKSELSQKDVLNKELAKLATDDIPVVVSAGNRQVDVLRANSVITEFAAKPNVFVVTSIDEKDAKPLAANYSQQHVLTSAPGVDIQTTIPGGGYEAKKGTFLAAAHLAGAITLARGKFSGNLSLKDLKKALVDPEASDQLESLNLVNIGSNRLNLGRLIAALSRERPQQQ